MGLKFVRRARNIVAAGCAGALLVFGGFTAPAQAVGARPGAAQASAPVKSIQIKSSAPGGQLDTVVTLTFDKPVDAGHAAQYSRQLTNSATSVMTATGQLGPAYISCGGSGAWADANGSLVMQYTCLSTRATIAWGFKISPALQAIIVGNVSERGLSWWRNGVAMPMNSPHAVPAYYQIHGSMTGANPNTQIDYQDYITFRHNVGSGGSGSITWAGRVHTLVN